MSTLPLRVSCLLLPSIASVVLLLTGCQSSQTVEGGGPAAASESVLRVGVTANVPPMIFKQEGKFVGVEADLAQRLAMQLGKSAKFVEVEWADQINALMSGRTDIIMSSMSVTPARATRIDFTKPYMRSGQMAVCRRPEVAGMQIGMFAKDVRVGVVKATTGDYFVQQEMYLAKRVTYSSAESGAKAVIRKRIDVFICDAPVAWWLAAEREEDLAVVPALLTEEYLAWGVRKGESALLDAANQFIEKSRESGELRNIVRTWIPNWN